MASLNGPTDASDSDEVQSIVEEAVSEVPEPQMTEEQATEMLLDAVNSEEAVDAELDDILLDDKSSQEWRIDTGLTDDKGTPKTLKVRVFDPNDNKLLASVLNAQMESGEDAGKKLLWDACVMEPANLSKYIKGEKKLPSVAQDGLTDRLMRLVGFHNYIKTLQARGMVGRPRSETAQPFMQSPPPTASPQVKSTSGLQMTSLGPTS